MKADRKRIKMFEKALRDAYLGRQDFPVTPLWRERVMSDILSLDTKKNQEDNIWSAGGAWRTAAVTYSLALLFVLIALNSSIGSEYEAARLFLEDPFDITMLQALLP